MAWDIAAIAIGSHNVGGLKSGTSLETHESRLVFIILVFKVTLMLLILHSGAHGLWTSSFAQGNCLYVVRVIIALNRKSNVCGCIS